MSIGRSFFVGAEPTRRWGPLTIYDRKRANEIAVKEMRQLGITRIDDGDRLVGGLSGGERQALAIARAVHFGASVLILDEPTAALGVKEAAHVLRIVLQARQKGIAVIFITHNVVHALTVGDHFAVLIRGAKAADFRKGEKSREEITDLMAGGEHMAELEAEIESYMATHDDHPPQVAADRDAGSVKRRHGGGHASTLKKPTLHGHLRGGRRDRSAGRLPNRRQAAGAKWQSGLMRVRRMISRKRSSSASTTMAGHS